MLYGVERDGDGLGVEHADAGHDATVHVWNHVRREHEEDDHEAVHEDPCAQLSACG